MHVEVAEEFCLKTLYLTPRPACRNAFAAEFRTICCLSAALLALIDITYTN